MRILILISCLISTTVFGQLPDFGLSRGEIGPTILSFKKPPNVQHLPCQAVFINYTNSPLQVNRIHPSGKMQKLVYLAAKDTVSVDTRTHDHLIVCYQGKDAGVMFVPIYDVNVCKIHDKQFRTTQRIPASKYKPVKSDVAAVKIKHKPDPKSYGSGGGPTILFDEAHLTQYTTDGLFKPFADLLKKDGYKVERVTRNFTAETLKGKILVIPNSYGQHVNGWLVDSANALTQHELLELRNWIAEGGRLLLIMDHTPYPGRMDNFARLFGFTFYDCHVIKRGNTGEPDVFSTENGTLNQHVILKGRNDSETVDQIATFAGSCMKIPTQAKPLITFGPDYQAVFSHAPWKLEQSDYKEDAEGLFQAAVMDYGKGKIAVFCESEMFTSLKQKKSGEKIGMGHPYANQNAQFVLNTIHWLDGFVE